MIITNISDEFLDDLYDEDFEVETSYRNDVFGGMSIKDVIANLQKRKDNISGGGINCIPFPFDTLRKYLPGVEQEQLVIVTASTKIGKTQITSYLYLYTVLEYCFTHPQQCSCHIIYVPLEESVARITERYMSHLLWQLDGMRVSPAQLRSTSTEDPAPQEALDLLQTKPYKDRLEFFEKCVEFDTEDFNPTGIRNKCVAYAKEVGTVKTHTVKANSDGSDIEVFDEYIPNDPNHFKILFIDHLSLIDNEKGMSLKQSMDKLTEYCVKYLRNRYKYTCIIVQQQAFEQEGLEAIKQKNIMPTLAGLSDSKYSSRDSNVVLGLFSPHKFGLETWLGYDIRRLGNYARFLKILAARDYEGDVSFGLFFDGATCDFTELPKPEDITELDKTYAKAEELRKRNKSKPKEQEHKEPQQQKLILTTIVLL